MGERALGGGTDAEVIRSSLTDPESFAAIFERHAAPVHRYLVTRVGRGAAEDLVGDTFATAFRSRSTYELSRPDARPWLFGIATNLARHHWRSEGRREARDARVERGTVMAEDPSDDVAATAWFRSQAAPIARALSQVDAAHLDVLLLVAGPGLSYDEVAQALDIPIGTVRSRLARGRRQLRELLGAPEHYLDGAAHDTTPAISAEGSP